VLEEKQNSQFKELLPLVIIWVVTTSIDRIWIALDHSVPAWDQTNHLTGSLNYLNALKNPHFFLGEWWQHFWMLSSKYPPLTYIFTAPFQYVFGTSPDQATLVNLLFSAVLISSVYRLGKHLFNQKAGFWAAVICLLLPRLYTVRLEYLLDYPLTALITASFCCLTIWRDTKKTWEGWRWVLGFGFCFGLAMMTKQSVLWFLFIPLLWIFCRNLWKRNWLKIAQLFGGLFLSTLIFGFWYRTNWIFFLSAEQRGIVESAMIEGDPALNTITAWTHYWRDLPSAVSFPLLIVPLVGFLLSLIAATNDTSIIQKKDRLRIALNFAWLAFYLIAAYLVCSSIVNKNPRYIMPYLPILAILLGYGLSLFPKRLKLVPWLTVCFAFILMCLNLFSIGGIVGIYITKTLSPNAQNYPYLDKEWPHAQIITEIIRTEPQLQATLGVLPRTAQINNHNLNYYGALQNFQVYGREAGTRKKFIAQDQRSLSWFITKTGNQGAPKEAQVLMVQSVENNPDFQVKKIWNLPDNSLLKLYQRIQPNIEVKPIPQTVTQVKLEQVILPQQSPTGVAIPVSYKWSGSWEQLQSGIVLLTWQHNKQKWLHDHAIAFGKLHPGNLTSNQLQGSFQITEQTAMLTPADIEAGNYTLQATYLNRDTGDNYQISVPPVTLKIAPNTPPTPAPELDLVTQLRTLAISLPKGRSALEQVFDEIGRINQYDPVQDYAIAAQRALEYRLQQEPQNREFAYALAFSNILRRDVDGAIAALKQVVQLDAKNPYAHAYLAFVYLYQWRGRAAQEALEPALALNNKIPEINALSGVAALLQGNISKAWDLLYGLKL
jgi:4-amino-4-deoxy-L-arabinose transferase-like glycosyltransferase